MDAESREPDGYVSEREAECIRDGDGGWVTSQSIPESADGPASDIPVWIGSLSRTPIDQPHA